MRLQKANLLPILKSKKKVKMQHRPTRANISLKNLLHNYRVLKGLLQDPDLFFCPMIKADAYGHGDKAVLDVLYRAGQKYFGLATLEEALALRENISYLNDDVQLLVFTPLYDESYEAALRARITLIISSWEEIEGLESALQKMDSEELRDPPRIHIKFNTGMSRLGFEASEAEKVFSYFYKNKKITVEGVCTHLAEGEDSHLKNGFSNQQFELFSNIEKKWNGQKIYFHALNSLGLIGTYISENKFAHWGARPGLALYGVKPQLHNLTGLQLENWKSIDLRPVMSVETQIVLTRNLTQGQSVSYNRRWTSNVDSTIAVLPIGYGDGYHRRLTNKGRMLIDGIAVPVVGTVCMDYTLVNVTALKDKMSLRGQTVTVIGESGTSRIAAEELAELIGTNAYEVLTSVSRRVPRVYK